MDNGVTYHFVVAWSEETGWYICLETTDRVFEDGKNVYFPNLDEWVRPPSDEEEYIESEVGGKEASLLLDLSQQLYELNEQKK